MAASFPADDPLPRPIDDEARRRPTVAPRYTDIVARYVGERPRCPLAKRLLGLAIVPACLLFMGGALLVTAPLPPALDSLLAVGLVGVAAGRCAAGTVAGRRFAARPTPANDNPVRPCLPPHLLRC